VLELGLKALIAYGLGSIVGALVVGSLRGVDIRTMGSGNAGGTNALRTQGLAFAAATVVIDVGKGWLAAGWLPGVALPGVAADPALTPEALAASCGFAAIAGHVWPLWHGFRGGKGGATLVGVLLALAPALLLAAVAVWVALVLAFGWVGLATTAAAVAVPVAALLARPPSTALVAFGLAVAALVAFAHRGNFARMFAGTEPRAGRLWLFRPRRPRT
jgi:glycerol-3-phosphate acyltransferase PlsY